MFKCCDNNLRKSHLNNHNFLVNVFAKKDFDFDKMIWSYKQNPVFTQNNYK